MGIWYMCNGYRVYGQWMLGEYVIGVGEMDSGFRKTVGVR